MVMSPIRPRFTPRGGFICSTPRQTSRNPVFYSSLMLSPIFDEDEVPSRQKIPQPFRASSRQDHVIGQKRSFVNKVAAAATNVRDVASGQKVLMRPPSSDRRKEPDTDYREAEKSPVKNMSRTITIEDHQEKAVIGQKRSFFNIVAAAAAAATNDRDDASGQKVVMHPPSSDRRKEPDTDYREEEKSPVKNMSRTITIEDHQEKAGERTRNSSERILQNVVASADPQSSVILGNPYKKQVLKTYQKGSKAKRRIEDGKYVSLNIQKRVEEDEKRLQRKGTFDNSTELKGGKEVHEEMRSPQKKQTLQNIIERNKESPQRKRLSANSEKSSGKEDQQLATVDSFDNIVIPNVQPEATRSPQKKETLENREKRKEKQQVVRERRQRKRLSRNSGKSSREEEQESVSESPGEKDLLCNNTSQKETMQNSMDRSVKSNIDEKAGEASDSSIERKQQVISKIPRRKRVPQNCQSSKQKENSQAVGESPQKKHTSQNSIKSKRKGDMETMTENLQRKHTSQNNIHSKMKRDSWPMRRSPRKKPASPDNMLPKGKKDPQALVESQKNQVSQNRIIKSRRKEQIISLEKQALQGSRRYVSRIEDKTSQPSEEVIKPKSKEKPLPVPEGHVPKQNKITRSRRKEETHFSEKQASQGSRSFDGKNESQTQDRTSQPSEELIKPKSKKNTLPEGHVPKSKRKKVVQGPSQRKEEPRNNSKQNTKPQMSDAEEEDGPLPRISARGDKTKSFNTSRISKVKSSHRTYKRVKKRRRNAGKLFAKFLALGRHSPEYNPFRNGQKLIAPSEDDGNLRRSKRTRVKPLDYWKGERCLYMPTIHGPDFLRISSPA